MRSRPTSGHRLHQGDTTVNHHLGVSGFAEHAVTSRRSAVRIPKDLPFEIAAVFGCAVLTGVGAVVHTANLRAGQSVPLASSRALTDKGDVSCAARTK